MDDMLQIQYNVNESEYVLITEQFYKFAVKGTMTSPSSNINYVTLDEIFDVNPILHTMISTKHNYDYVLTNGPWYVGKVINFDLYSGQIEFKYQTMKDYLDNKPYDANCQYWTHIDSSEIVPFGTNTYDSLQSKSKKPKIL